jgi:hypothetical protein
MKPTIGQIIFGLNVGNAARHCEQKLTKMIVTSVGNKYFKARKIDDASGWTEDQFYNDGWKQKTDCSATIFLYESEQSYFDENEVRNICVKLSKFFGHGKNSKHVSLQNLRAILKLIEGENSDSI